MGCLLAMFAGLFPRLALLILWIARPERIDAVFDTFLLPTMGGLSNRPNQGRRNWRITP
jgi:hypothetical protein